MKCKVCGSKTTIYGPGEERQALKVPDEITGTIGFKLLKPSHFCSTHGLVEAIDDAQLSMAAKGEKMNQPCKDCGDSTTK